MWIAVQKTLFIKHAYTSIAVNKRNSTPTDYMYVYLLH